MSSRNVEIVLEQFRLWSEGDLDGAMALMAPDVVVIAPEGWPEGSVTEGREAWRLQAARLRDGWEEARVEVEDVRELDDGRVVAEIRYVTKGAEAGIAFDTPMAVVFTLGEGMVEHAHFRWELPAELR